jgi:alpha-1,6-mannosyltransferase
MRKRRYSVCALPTVTSSLILGGSVLVATSITLAVSQARLGTPLFFAMAALAAACQLAVLASLRHRPAERRLLLIVFAFAVAARLPLALGPVSYDSDMIRYIWDGRVQRFGINPYGVVPADPAVAHTHDANTVRMPSRNDRTPYPPAAQLFFRAVVTITESPRAMKLVLTLCDLLTMVLLWRWLQATGRNEWLVLTYAWNPLVVLEVAHSGHIDGLGAMWILMSAFCLSRKRTTLAALTFTLAVATKLLPVVLAPLYLGRVRPRDIVLGALLLVALYWPFASTTMIPVGAVPTVVQHIRFNSPVFRPLAWVITPQGAAVFALAVGFGAAVWARVRLDANHPAAWAWPMALALACAPVIYPWYLLYFTPFLFTRATLPLALWTYTVIPVYVVWERARHGIRWKVPNELMILEYGLLVVAIGIVMYATAARSRAVDDGALYPAKS